MRLGRRTAACGGAAGHHLFELWLICCPCVFSRARHPSPHHQTMLFCVFGTSLVLERGICSCSGVKQGSTVSPGHLLHAPPVPQHRNFFSKGSSSPPQTGGWCLSSPAAVVLWFHQLLCPCVTSKEAPSPHGGQIYFLP